MADGVWRTIKGRHVYIQNKSGIDEWAKKRKEEIQGNRDEVLNRIKTAKEGYAQKNKLEVMQRNVSNKYSSGYNSDKKEYVYQINEELTPEEKVYFEKKSAKSVYGPGGDAGYLYRRKHYKSNGDDRTYYQDALNSATYDLKELTKDRDTGTDWTNKDTYKNGKIALDPNFEKRMNNSGINPKRAQSFNWQASTAVAGNYKSDYQREVYLTNLYNDVDKYYKKNPIEINESNVKRLDTRIMDPALQYLQTSSEENAKFKQSTGPYGYEAIKNWKYVEEGQHPNARQAYMNRQKSLYEGDRDYAKRYNNTKVIYDNDDFLVTAHQIGRPNGEKEYYVESFKGENYLGWRAPASLEVKNDWYIKGNDKPYVKASWGSGEAKTTQEAQERLGHAINAVSIAEDFNKNVKDIESYFPKEKNYVPKNNSELVQNLIERGYSAKTAEKMAREMIKARKRK